MTRKIRSGLMATAAGVLALTGVSCTNAQSAQYNLPSEALGQALKDLAHKANVPVVAASDLVAGKTSSAVVGARNAGEALSSLLVGTGLHADLIAGAYVIRRDPSVAIADASSPAADKDIVVTGTRIHGGAPIGTPLTVIDRKAIEDSGHATVAEYIQTLPQNYNGGQNEGSYGNNSHTSDNIAYGSSINLRGLGTESTLVLFDGSRPALGGSIGAFVDTSLIPTVAIDRVEILGDGASAIYGTDAVAGVANVRFRNRYDGFETHLFEGAAGGALHQEQASQAAGKRWSTGGIFLAYQYDHRSNLPGDSRAQWTENLTPFGGPDNRGPYSVPGTIVAANGETFGIPGGQDGRNLNAGDLIPGVANLTDRHKAIDILPQQTTHSVYAAVDQKLTDHIGFYARALYAHRNFDASSDLGSISPYSVPTSNPFYVDPIGTGEPVQVDYDFSHELGNPETRGHLDAITTSAGLQGNWAGWSVDLNGAYGRQRTRDARTNNISARRVGIALADTDPSTALNLFGSGSSNNPATLDFIRSTDRDVADSTVWSAALRIDGPLFELPAGTVKLAAGAEHRNEQFNSGYFYNSTEATPDIYDYYPAPGTPGQRHIDAVYGELSIPVLNAPGGIFPGKLDVSVAGRIDRYSDVGRTANPKAGLTWTIVQGVTVRGSWGTSFRAPTFYENAGPANNLYYPYPAPDPHSSTGTSGAILLSGYSPDMRPERAATWTAGFDLKPDQIPGLTISATYFAIAYRDRIAQPGQDVALFLSEPEIYGALIETPTPAEVAALYASPQLNNYYGVPASDIKYIFNIETQNLSRTHVRGVDFSLSYTHALLGGSATVDLNGTRLIAMDQQITGTAPSADILGTIFNPVRLRTRGHVGWGKGGLSVDAFVNYTSGYRNTLVSPSQRVRSWTTVDGQIGYRFADASPLSGARVALSATNLLNQRPPYVNYEQYGTTFGYDPNQASLIGRQLSVDLTFQW